MTSRSRRLTCVGLLLAVASLAGCNRYVALGDSYTAGPGITPQDPAIPGCLRSDVNYPTLIAPDLPTVQFRDVSCSGAQTVDMTNTQDVDPDPDNPPQFNALSSNTTIVTLGIGGNDIGFVAIARKCVELGATEPLGNPCERFYKTSGELEPKFSALASNLAAVLAGIETRAPNAKVFVVGYPAILPETSNAFVLCQPFLPVAQGDVRYLREQVAKRLNRVIKNVTVARDHIYVDTYTPSIGHDACQEPPLRWVEPLVPAADAAPVHPNRRGMKGIAQAVRASMRANGIPVQ